MFHDRPDQYELVLDTSEMARTITVDLASGDAEGTFVEITPSTEHRDAHKGFAASVTRRHPRRQRQALCHR